jgi:5'-3' exonuclease
MTSTPAQERSGPLLLLDGMSLAFRAYYALPDTLATSSGVVTNAVHGFTSMLVYLIREHHPSALAVAFDAPGATFRDEILEDYKAGRAETPWLLPPQFDMIREVMEALAIPVVEAPGFEADDVLATLATEAVERQTEVVIVTGDRDSFQLVQDPYVRVLYNKRGVSDYALYDETGIFDRCGVPPSQYVLLASLRGDPSDNLPGIPGVGEKTAAKLLTKYGDLDGIFAHLDEQTPKLRENLAENEELARSNARIIPLVRDVPLEVDVTHLTLGSWDRAIAEATFDRFEMKTVWGRLEELLDAGALGEPVPGSEGPSAKGAEAVIAASTLGRPSPAEPVVPPFDLRDVALPTTAAEVTTQLSELGTGRLALAARWTGMPGRSDLVALVLVATEGEEAGLGVLIPAGRWCGCWPGWRWPVSAWTRPSCGASPTVSSGRLRPAGGPDPRGGGRELQRELDAAVAGGALPEAGVDARPEDEDGFLDRRSDAGEVAGPASGDRDAAALPRGGEAAVDLRGEPAGRGGSRRPDPRHLPTDGGPDGPAVVGPAEPAQHPGAHRGGPATAPRLRARARPALPGGRLRPDRAASDRPSGRRPRSDRPSPKSGHPPDDRGARLRVPAEEVTGASANRAKMVSYGLAYGMEAFGLSQRLGVAVEEAAAIMESYFGAFPLVKQYMDHAVADAKIEGATRTLFGRIRPLPDLLSSNYRVRQAAERQAMNAGIQGLAADIFKLALVRLDRDMEAEKLASRLVLQVHDEVIVEMAPGEGDAVHRLTESALTGAADLKVPLTISVATGPSWAAAKG